MWNPPSQAAYNQHPFWDDPEGIVREIMENAATSSPDTTMLPIDPYLVGLTTGGTTGQQDALQANPLQCVTPPDSVKSATPSPIGIHAEMAPSGQMGSDGNFDCSSLIFPNPGPSNPQLLVPVYPLPPRPNEGHLDACADPFSSGVEGRQDVRLASRRPQVVSAKCSQASIEILNPREEYDKIQRKHGPKGKFSEQRIANGQVEMRIRTSIRLAEVFVYVMRDPEAEKKLTAKDRSVYGVGPVKLDKRDIKPVPSGNPALEPPTYICKFDLDCVYKTPDNKEVYRLEKTKGTEYNRFWLKVYLGFVDGSHVVLYPYEFVLKSGKTLKYSTTTTSLPPRSSPSAPSSGQHVPPDTYHSRLMTEHLEAEFARIKTLEVEQIQTANHDIAYYIKKKNPGESLFEEGDVVGFFASPTGDDETVIDLLTSENARNARLAGVISRSAYLAGNTGRLDRERKDADLVCIIGEIKVKVIGKVRPGDFIYTCHSDKFPGTATAQHERGHKSYGNLTQTLLGYAMGHSSGPGLSKVDCLVSLVLSVNARERLRELGQLRRSIKEVRENLEVHIDNVGHRITSMQKGWRGIWKKLLGIFIFLAIVSLVCGLMLPPNSPFVKAKCQKGSKKGHHLLIFSYYPPDSEEEIRVVGLEFTWKNLKKKLNLNFGKINGTGYKYYLNKRRCETGGMRAIATWLDPAPTFPQVNVLAVDHNCTTVFYHNMRVGKWASYEKGSVKNIDCNKS